MYSDFVQLSATRNHALIEACQLHQFTRDCEDVEAWVCEKELVAANEDLGKDVEHVEVRMCVRVCVCEGMYIMWRCEQVCTWHLVVVHQAKCVSVGADQ